MTEGILFRDKACPEHRGQKTQATPTKKGNQRVPFLKSARLFNAVSGQKHPSKSRNYFFTIFYNFLLCLGIEKAKNGHLCYFNVTFCHQILLLRDTPRRFSPVCLLLCIEHFGLNFISNTFDFPTNITFLCPMRSGATFVAPSPLKDKCGSFIPHTHLHVFGHLTYRPKLKDDIFFFLDSIHGSRKQLHTPVSQEASSGLFDYAVAIFNARSLVIQDNTG